VDHQRAAEIQVALEGVTLPASRDELVRYAETQDPPLAVELRTLLPESTFETLNDVAETLAPVQPAEHEARRVPAPESGEPPGGVDYLNPSPESGAVRDSAPPGNPPQRVLEQQASLQQKQQQRQALNSSS
jgi:hypothetical protein